jgi:hypothetical protein
MRKEHQLTLTINKFLFEDLGKTRLLSGNDGFWNGVQSGVVAATMLEGTLRKNIFSRYDAAHRKLLSTAGLRAVDVRGLEATEAGRYQPLPGAQYLREIQADTTFTPASPMGYTNILNPVVRGASIFPRLDPVREMMALIPVIVEPPKNGLDLVLRCLPHLNMYALLCAQECGSVTSNRITAFVRGSALPREVGGFQDNFKDAVKLVFGASSKSRELLQRGGRPDVFLVANDQPCTVEMLVDNNNSLASIKSHHDRWFDEETHKTYWQERGNGVTVAFVQSGNLPSSRDLIDKNVNLEVPLLSVAFEHGAFNWNCRLFRKDTQPLDFTLDIDGVAMKLVGDTIEVAQQIASSTSELIGFISERGPHSTRKIITFDGDRKKITTTAEWSITAENLLDIQGLDPKKWVLCGPNRFNQKSIIDNDAILPLGNLRCPFTVEIRKD